MTDAPARRPLPLPWTQLRPRLQKEIVRLIETLGRTVPHPVPRLMQPRNPMRDDRHPGSFVIWLHGDAAGAWRDYATDEHGDVVDLIAYLSRFKDRMDAYWWALDFLRVDRQGQGEIRSAEQTVLDRQRQERERRARDAKAEKIAADKSAALFNHWLTLHPFKGTLAETYLREARRIPLDRLAHWPGAIRFEPRADHFDEKTGEVTSWPCMVTAMTRGSKCAGLHRTWLAPDGGGKAPVDKPKKMIGPIRGAAIRLSPGPSGLSPAKAELRAIVDPLAIGEGIETTLSVACVRGDYRAWAAGSLSLIGALAWPACASAVILLKDNDWKPEALAAFERIEARWLEMAEGRPMVVASSAVGSDWNDWARSK